MVPAWSSSLSWWLWQSWCQHCQVFPACFVSTCALPIRHYHAPFQLLTVLTIERPLSPLSLFSLQLKWKCKKDDDMNGGYSQDVLLRLLQKVHMLEISCSFYRNFASVWWITVFNWINKPKTDIPFWVFNLWIVLNYILRKCIISGYTNCYAIWNCI